MSKRFKNILIGASLVFITSVPVIVIAQTINSVSKSISAQNTFTDAFNPINYSISPTRSTGYFNISVSGDDVGTSTLQRSFDAGTTWIDHTQWTAGIVETSMTDSEGTVTYRIGVKTGDYTVGTATYRLSN